MDSDQPNAPNNRTAQREGRPAAKCFVETTEPLVQVRLFRKNRKQAARAKLKQLQSKKPAAKSNQCSSQYVQSKVNRVGLWKTRHRFNRKEMEQDKVSQAWDQQYQQNHPDRLPRRVLNALSVRGRRIGRFVGIRVHEKSSRPQQNLR